VRSAQTGLFSDSQLDAFTATAFRRAHEANRMGVRVDGNAGALQVAGGLTVVSEIISPGDIQMTGAGLPFVLLYECQTTGGYPRIATVIPADMPRAAQAPAGVSLRFQFVDTDTAVEAERRFRAHMKALPGLTEPLVRDPADIAELLSYQLVSGVTAGDDDTI
jgi:allophanate hydrolase